MIVARTYNVVINVEGYYQTQVTVEDIFDEDGDLLEDDMQEEAEGEACRIDSGLIASDYNLETQYDVSPC